ncbi:hypothetical protein EL84_11355 [Paenibacillus sp. VT-400]|uniref:hypothetical protein n=1 Tax=Paenibacillus sp. VT-400 TaxID=1495853 RepID=UPI00064A6442|nr:hypothetical protein [Paenibacillus sp. VT-400]KLU52975.1 hypothetical protein EL84_11355 [Paenibacillus sp. VT-400]
MGTILDTLEEIYSVNSTYIGKIKPSTFDNLENFGNWMSAFVVRRVKKDMFNDDMKIINIIQKSSSYDANRDIEQLKEKKLVLDSQSFLIVTELGIIVHHLSLRDKGYFKDINNYILEAYSFIGQGNLRVAQNKIDKLFPHGLSTKEMTFVIFLLLNGAYSKETAFVVMENTSGFEYQINSIVGSLHYIGVKFFDESFDFTMEDKEFSNFLRRNTANGTIGRIFNNYFFSQYEKLENKRTIYFDLVPSSELLYDEDQLNNSIDDIVSTLLESTSSIIENEMLLYKFREIVVEYLIKNRFDAHQLLIFFNNVNYRDSLYSLLTVIDKRVSQLKKGVHTDE